MKLLPFAVLYGNSRPGNVVLSSTYTVVSGTVAQINAAITELNTNYANYGYGASPNLPALPAVPTPGSTYPGAIAYFQSYVPGATYPGGGSGPSSSYLLIDGYTSNGFTDPYGLFDTLTVDQTLVNMQVALASLSTAVPVAISVQPTNQSISHSSTGAISLTATGAGATFNWYIQVLGTNAFVLISPTTATGSTLGVGTTGLPVFSTYNTASLTISYPVLAQYNGSKICCIVYSASGAQSVKSTTVTLTVT
jgi:hypothetical protein